MKKMITIAGMVGVLCSATSSFAASPKDIKYASKQSNMLGGEYYIYNVICSDGKKREISAWNKRKEWCSSTKRADCSSDQLKAAKKACEK